MKPLTTFRIALLASTTLLTGCLTPQLATTGLPRLFGGPPATTPVTTAGAPNVAATVPARTPAPGSAASGAAPTPNAAADTTRSATRLPSTPPSAPPSGSAIPASAPPASAQSADVTSVGGGVYDEEGDPVNGALVTVRSLDPSVPYTATAETSGGAWAVHNVPIGANIEIAASKAGWTTRRRVGSFQGGGRNVINFGNAGGYAFNEDDAFGAAYFISDYVEIVSTSPYDLEEDVDGEDFELELQFSEELSDATRDALRTGLLIYEYGVEPVVPIAPDDLDFEWDSDLRTVHVRTSQDLKPGTRYAVGLISPDGEPLESEDGDPLGLSTAFTWSNYQAGGWLMRIIKSVDLGLKTSCDCEKGADNWAATHEDLTVFTTE